MNELDGIMRVAIDQVTPNLNGLKQPFYSILWVWGKRFGQGLSE